MTIRRYTPRAGRTRHHLDVRIPRLLWVLLERRGARRDPLETLAERTREHTMPVSTEKFDYWADSARGQ